MVFESELSYVVLEVLNTKSEYCKGEVGPFYIVKFYYVRMSLN